MREIPKVALGALLSAGGFLGFVAAVGGAIVWTRFQAAELPADQAIAALPRGELIATGAVTLSIFCLLGVLAAIAVSLIDYHRFFPEKDGGGGGAPKRVGAAPSRDLSRGLLVLVTVEALVVLIVAEAPRELTMAAAEAVVVLGALAVLVTLPRSPFVMSDDGDLSVRQVARRVAEPFEVALRRARRRDARDADDADKLLALGASLVAWAPLAGVWIALGLRGEPDEAFVWLGSVLIVAGFVTTLWYALEKQARRSGSTGDESQPAPDAGSQPEDGSQPLELETEGRVAMLGLGGLMVTVPTALLGELWTIVPLAVAVLLAIGIWSVARIAARNPGWTSFLTYSGAVFISVPLLGGVTGVAKNYADPQVQPIALIRAGDGLDEALQGIYVTENDERIYFASVATGSCGGDLLEDSGRLLWVDRDDVVAMSIGPAQSVDDAGQTALEMYYALAPGAANPFAGEQEAAGGASVQEAAEGEGSPSGGPVEGAPAERRLEASAPALRRRFGASQQLTVDAARVNQVVTLRGEGFGDAPQGRIVRVGGVEAKVRGRDWTDRAISFRVPEGATSGTVTIECPGIETQPVLRVEQRPVARIALRLNRNSWRVGLDAAESSDDGQIERWRWRLGPALVEGRRHIVREISTSHGLYPIALRVTDDDGDTGRARAWVWRVSARDLFVGGDPAGRRQLRALRRLLVGDVRIVVQGHVASLGSRELDGAASRQLAERTHDLLLAAKGLEAFDDRTRSYGVTCPAHGPRHVPGNRYVEIFVFDPSAHATLPPGCQRWHDDAAAG